MSDELKIGVVEKFFAKPMVAIVKVEEEPFSVGDTLRFKGTTTDFTQKVDSMQVNHAPVDRADKGASVGVKVLDRVREKDLVFKVGD